MPQLAQPITLGDGAKGFAYVAGFGPGGSAYGATVTSPDGKFDVSITLAFSSAIGSKKIQKLQAYYDALAKKGKGGMLGLLQAILTKAYPSITSNHALLQQSQPSPDISLLASNASRPLGSPASTNVLANTSRPVEAESSLKASEWILGSLMVFMVFVGIGLLVRYKR